MDSPPTLDVTVGIATWNRAEVLAGQLEALTRLDVPPGLGWEVVVCDNNSTDRTEEVTRSYEGRLPVRYVFEPRQGLVFAHQRVDRESRGAWILFTDDDARVHADWLRAHIDALRARPELAFYGGEVILTFDQPLPERSAFILEHFPWVYAAKRIAEPRRIAADPADMPHGANMAIRRDALRAVGLDPSRGLFGDDRVGGEDTQLGLDLVAEGYEGWLLPESRVDHAFDGARSGLEWFCRWHLAEGENRVVEEGPAHRGRFGHLWMWKMLLRLGAQAALRRVSDRREAYGLLADTSRWYGYMRATRRGAEQRRNRVARAS